LLAAADLFVNCPSLGMVGKPPLEVDLGPLKRSAVVCDMVCVPLETPLLIDARARGHRTVDGLGMLLEQAGFGFEKWFGVMPKASASAPSIARRCAMHEKSVQTSPFSSSSRGRTAVRACAIHVATRATKRVTAASTASS
jgi:hypothetical protein